MQNYPFTKLPLRYWYLNPDIDPNDPKVIQEYYWKQVNAGKEEIEERQKKKEEDREIKLDEKDLKRLEKQLEKELQKAFDKMDITIKL